MQIQSRPPDNITEAVNMQLEAAANAAPEDVAIKLSSVLQLAAPPAPTPGDPPAVVSPQQDTLYTNVLDTLDISTDAAPPTMQVAVQQAAVITTVIDAGKKDLRAVQSLETLVQNAADNGLFDIQNPSLMGACFHSIGSILPDVSAGGLLPGRVRGQSTTMDKYRRPVNEFDPGARIMDMMQQEEKWLKITAGRQDQNHPVPVGETRMVQTCTSAFCDIIYLACMPEQESDLIYTCCDAQNGECLFPPCWFRGLKCPRSSSSSAPVASGERRLAPGGENSVWLGPWKEKHDDNPFGRSRQESFGAAMTPNPNISREKFIYIMEQDEKMMLEDIRKAIRVKKVIDSRYIMNDMRTELVFQSMPLGEAIDARQSKQEYEKQFDDDLLEAERQVSQIITRAAVLRDTICKAGISQMTIGENMRFSNAGFTVWFGKTRNLSKVQEQAGLSRPFRGATDGT